MEPPVLNALLERAHFTAAQRHQASDLDPQMARALEGVDSLMKSLMTVPYSKADSLDFEGSPRRGCGRLGRRMIERIHIEEQVRNHPRALAVLKRFPKAQRIVIERYGELFNRKAQNFRLQKKKPALILAANMMGMCFQRRRDTGSVGRTITTFLICSTAFTTVDTASSRGCSVRRTMSSSSTWRTLNQDWMRSWLITRASRSISFQAMIATLSPWSRSPTLRRISCRFSERAQRLVGTPYQEYPDPASARYRTGGELRSCLQSDTQ